VRNASVRFDPQTYAPTYQLDLGSPGQSLAFALARRMHLDDGVIARAETLLTAQERDYERALAELADERTRTTAEREVLLRDRAQLRMLEDQTRKRAELLERDRREIAQRAEAQLANALRTFTAELDLRAAARGERTRGARVTRGQSELLARTIEEVRASLGIDAQRAEPRAAPSAALAPGDRVRILSLESDGTVVEVLDHDVMVQLGALRMSVPRSDVRRRGGPAPRIERDEHASGAARLAAATAARAELDVRGKRFVEAQPLVERWIDESVLADASPLRLIHGKGTGLLGRGLQQYLREHPRVRDVRFGGPDEGGSGVTVFELA
jgi:DNA mismatch repair protein MutS2